MGGFIGSQGTAKNHGEHQGTSGGCQEPRRHRECTGDCGVLMGSRERLQRDAGGHGRPQRITTGPRRAAEGCGTVVVAARAAGDSGRPRGASGDHKG
jgi:hypothetical protein